MDSYRPDQDPEPYPPPLWGARFPLFPVRATYALIAVNVLIFFLTLLSSNLLYGLGALVPIRVIQRGEWWRLLMSGFLHAGVMHIGFNMYALYLLGREMEAIFGTLRFLVTYTFALVGGSLAVLLFTPLNTVTVGASGAVLGVLGALLAYYWQHQENIAGGRRRLANLATMALVNLAIGLSPGISLWGHLGGTLFGFLAGLALVPRYRFVEGGFYPRVVSEGPRRQELLGAVILFGVCLALFITALLIRG
ncbi:MAG: rhomboid family intramembrane serine protease [Anaerolineales bacterium]